MDWMISLRKHIEGGTGAPLSAEGGGTLHEVAMAGSLSAYREALEVFGESAQKAVPGIGADLVRSLTNVSENLGRQAEQEISAPVRETVRTELNRWSDRALKYHAENEREIKEILNGVARAADTIGRRDERYGREVGDLTTKFRSIADLKDLAPIRRSILDTTAALKACMEKLAEENKVAVTELSAQVEHFRGKLAEAEQSAAVDPLTGLANRRTFEQQLERRIAARVGFSLILLDLNDFKGVNDKFGHVAGDSLLTQFANELKAQFRASDLVGRWGGDEFVVIVDGGIAEAELRAGRVRQWAMGEYSLDAGTRKIKIQVSAGMGVVEWDGRETGKSLLGRADQKLYAGKAHTKMAARELASV